MFFIILYFFYFATVETRWVEISHYITNHTQDKNTKHIYVEDEEAVLVRWKAILRDENERV